MIAGRRIWLAALILCALGVLGCVGLALWLAGASWQAQRQQGVQPATRSAAAEPAADQARKEADRFLFAQATVFLVAAVFVILIVLLALLWRRLGPGEPPPQTDTTDLWRRNVPPDDEAEGLEAQWRKPSDADAT